MGKLIRTLRCEITFYSKIVISLHQTVCILNVGNIARGLRRANDITVAILSNVIERSRTLLTRLNGSTRLRAYPCLRGYQDEREVSD